jgi:hypothetical protein
MPEELHGWYCATCCPACKAQPLNNSEPLNEEPKEEPAIHQAA